MFLIKVLLENGAVMDVGDAWGLTPLDLAAIGCYLKKTNADRAGLKPSEI